MTSKLLLVLALLAAGYVFSQEDEEHAWVHFKDKANVAEALKTPITILTQKAINRKKKYNIPIDERDVPVNELYISKIKQQTGIVVKAKSKWFNCVHVVGRKAAIEKLKTQAFVKTIVYADRGSTVKQPITLKKNKYYVEAQPQPNTPLLSSFDYGKAANQIKMFKGDVLHKKGYTGKGMTMAVIDDGFKGVNTFEAFKPLFSEGRVLGTYDFVKRETDVYSKGDHGNRVLSCIASALNGKMVGTAPDASFYLFITEIEGKELPEEESNWVEAVERADSLGVDVINASLGYHKYSNSKYSYKKSDLNGKTAFITRGATMASDKGMLLVIPAGNLATDRSWRLLNVPADSPGVLTVGAVDAKGRYASFSSLGSSDQPTQKPDVTVQGRGAVLINTKGDVAEDDGTSFSSPIMSGGVVCLWQALPHLNNKQIMQIVRESASQYTKPDFKMGYGIPNLDTALTLSNKTVTPSLAVKVHPNPATTQVTITVVNNVPLAQVDVYNVLGKKLKTVSITPKNNSLNIAGLPSGVYLLNVKVGTATTTIKLVKH